MGIPGKSGWSDGKTVAKVPMESGERSTSFLLMSARASQDEVYVRGSLAGALDRSDLTCIGHSFLPCGQDRKQS